MPRTIQFIQFIDLYFQIIGLKMSRGGRGRARGRGVRRGGEHPDEGFARMVAGLGRGGQVGAGSFGDNGASGSGVGRGGGGRGGGQVGAGRLGHDGARGSGVGRAGGGRGGGQVGAGSFGDDGASGRGVGRGGGGRGGGDSEVDVRGNERDRDVERQPPGGRRIRFLNRDQILASIEQNDNDDEDSEDSDLEELHGGEDGFQDSEDEEQEEAHEEPGEPDGEQGGGGEGGGVYEGEHDDNQRVGRVRRKDRAVHDLDSSLKIENYDHYQYPEVREEYTATLEKKTRNQPAKTITWENQPRVRVGRRSRENILEVEGGVCGDAVLARTPGECFTLFFSQEVLDMIVYMTNKNIDRFVDGLTPDQLAKYTGSYRFSIIHHTTVVEMRAFFGLFLARGMMKLNNWNLQRLWREGLGPAVFSATMGKHRFKFLNKHIMFDNPDTRQQRWRLDRFAAAREFFEMWNDRCGQMLQMADYGAVDECLYACRNQLGFKTYNPNKPAKYGINIKCLNEVRCAYTHRSEVFAGKPVEQGHTPYYIPNTEGITMRLFEQYGWRKLKGRNITMDNLYSSIPMAEKMLQKGVTMIGTMRHNRKGLPKEIKSVAGRTNFSSIIWHEKEKGKFSLNSYVVDTKSKGKKNVIVLATVPVLLGVTKDDGKQKPAIIKTYDFTKGGTDICDQRTGNYSTSTKSPKWTKKILSYMLDVSRVNSQTIHSLNHNLEPRKVDSFDYGWSLVLELVTPHIQDRRNNTPGLNKPVTEKMDMYLRLQAVPAPVPVAVPDPAVDDQAVQAGVDAVPQDQAPALDLLPHPKTGADRRCKQCLHNLPTGAEHKAAKNKMHRVASQCQGCQEATCKNHIVHLCPACYEQRVGFAAQVAVQDELAV